MRVVADDIGLWELSIGYDGAGGGGGGGKFGGWRIQFCDDCLLVMIIGGYMFIPDIHSK